MVPGETENTAAQDTPRGFVRVAFFSADEDISRLIWKYSNVPHLRTRVVSLPTLSELSFVDTTMQGVLVVDVTEQFDAESLLSANARRAISECEIIVLCSHTDANYWLDMAMREEIGDYHIVRPLNDPGNLKLKIWRAIDRSAAKPLSRTKEPDPASQDAHLQAPARRELSAEAPLAGKRVLIVEDDVASSEAMRDMLISEGLEVKAAGSVIEAYRRFADLSFDIVLLDLMMPGISGPAAVRTIREKLNCSEAPLIVTTAYSERDLVEECLREGATDYLVKPITRKTLIPRIVLALGLKLKEAQQPDLGGRAEPPPVPERSSERGKNGH